MVVHKPKFNNSQSVTDYVLPNMSLKSDNFDLEISDQKF